MAGDVKNPHDAFFKLWFSHRQTAAEFLRYRLPPELSRLFDLRRLELVKDAFVDAKLQEHFADLLYRVGLVGGGSAFVHLLLEHKSWPDDWVAFQGLRYAVLDWAAEQQKKVKKLPVIVPVVIYHGAQKWDVPDSLSALFEVPDEFAALRRFVPEFRYWLCDLSAYNDTELAQGEYLASVLLGLGHVFDRHPERGLADALGQAKAIRDERDQVDMVSTLTLYYQSGSKLSQEEILDVVQEEFTGNLKDVKFPLFEEWKALGLLAGRQEGLQQGLQQGLQALRNAALTQLRIKFGALNEQTEKRVQALSLTQLEELLGAILQFNKPADLTAWLRRQAAKTK